jgi:anti-anti-sigma factor
MTFSTTCSSSGCTLSINGELDALTVADLRREIDRLVQGRHRLIVVDLAGLRMIDSSGVAALVSLYKRIRAREGKVSIRAAGEQPLAVLKLLKLDEVLLERPEAGPVEEPAFPRSVPA